MGVYSSQIIGFVLLLIAFFIPFGCGKTPVRTMFTDELERGKPPAFTDHPFERRLHSSGSNRPSYRHRILQLYEKEWRKNAHGSNQNQVQFQGRPMSLATYPVAAKLSKIYPVEQMVSIITGNLVTGKNYDKWIQPKRSTVPESDGEAVVYNPYIGMRSFTSIMTFFHHVRDNFKGVSGLKPKVQTDMDER